jgi:hypothetical protein
MKLYRITILLVVLLLGNLQASAQHALGHEKDEVEAVLKQVDSFMETLTTNDIELRGSLQTPDGMNYVAVLRPDGSWRVIGRANSAFLNPPAADAPKTVEKYWDPVVFIRGPLAMVWNPFEFWVNDSTSHCGVNMMQLVKTDGTWKLANTIWTQEPPESCESLRPTDLSEMRPN